MAACQKAEEEEAAEHGKISESDSEVAENKIFIDTITPSDDSFSERNDTNIEEETGDYKDENLGKQEHTSEPGTSKPGASWIRSGESLCAKYKPIRILEGDALIPKQISTSGIEIFDELVELLLLMLVLLYFCTSIEYKEPLPWPIYRHKWYQDHHKIFHQSKVHGGGGELMAREASELIVGVWSALLGVWPALETNFPERAQG